MTQFIEIELKNGKHVILNTRTIEGVFEQENGECKLSILSSGSFGEIIPKTLYQDLIVLLESSTVRK